MTEPFKTGRVDRTACLLLALISGAYGPEDSGPPRVSDDGDRKILRIAYNREIDVLNALTSQMLLYVHCSMVEGLVTTDQNNVYIPVLAKEIPTEENGLAAGWAETEQLHRECLDRSGRRQKNYARAHSKCQRLLGSGGGSQDGVHHPRTASFQPPDHTERRHAPATPFGPGQRPL